MLQPRGSHRYRTFDELEAAVASRRENSHEAIWDLTNTRVGVDRSGDLRLAGGQVYDGARFSNWSYGQVCRLVGAPESLNGGVRVRTPAGLVRGSSSTPSFERDGEFGPAALMVGVAHRARPSHGRDGEGRASLPRLPSGTAVATARPLDLIEAGSGPSILRFPPRKPHAGAFLEPVDSWFFSESEVGGTRTWE